MMSRHREFVSAVTNIALFFFLQLPPVAIAGATFENPVVPNAQLGPFRHGTYPSKGDTTHVGVDLVAPCGADIYPIEDGEVTDVIHREDDRNFNSLGYMVILKHPGQFNGRRTYHSIYLHMQAPPHVTIGKWVESGKTVLGKVGATGAAGGVCHTHFELRYFDARFGAWGNIYGPGDQRRNIYFVSQWENPEKLFDTAMALTAIKRGDAKRLSALIGRGVSPDTRSLAGSVDSRGSTLLMLSVCGDLCGISLQPPQQLAVATMLLDRGADVNARNSTGDTPLHYAVHGPHDIEPEDSSRGGERTLQVLKLLLDRGADLNAVNSDGQTALLSAAGSGYYRLAEMLLQRGATNGLDKAIRLAQEQRLSKTAEVLSRFANR